MEKVVAAGAWELESMGGVSIWGGGGGGVW